MKTFAQASAIFLVIVISAVLCFFIFTSVSTKTETEYALSQAVEQSIYLAMTENTYTIEDDDEFVADVIQNLLVQSTTKADYTIRILAVDKINGLLDIEVTQVVLKDGEGDEETTKCRKTVILEEYS